MKPENKLPVLDLISAEMKTVVNTLQPDLPPWPATGTIAEQRQYYTLERRFWNMGAPEISNQSLQGSNKIWAGENTYLFIRSQIGRRRYFICMEAVLFSAISIPTIASCACWQATANVR